MKKKKELQQKWTPIFKKKLRPIIYIMLNNVDKIAGDVVHHNRMILQTCTVLLKKFSNWFFFVKALRGITGFIHKLTS